MLGNKQGVTQFLRFCIVGGMNTAVDFAAFFLLHSLGVPYAAAQVLSYSCGTANSFFFNRKWTFGLSHGVNMSEVIKFLVVNGASLLCSFGLLFLLYDMYQYNLWISKLVATGFGVVVNYIGSRLWVFTQKEQIRSELE